VPGLLGQFKLHGQSSFLLAYRRAFDCISIWSNVLDPQGDHITSAQLAIDGYVEHRQLANSAFDLQLCAD
jgi:hypothetical protein